MRLPCWPVVIVFPTAACGKHRKKARQPGARSLRGQGLARSFWPAAVAPMQRKIPWIKRAMSLQPVSGTPKVPRESIDVLLRQRP